MAMDNFCQSPVTTNTKRKNANIPNKRRITSYILEETLKGLMLHSTINNSAYYNLDEGDAESDPKIDPLVATHTGDGNKIKATDTETTNENSPQKLLINRTILIITTPINLQIVDGVEAGIGTAHVRQTIASKVIVTDTARSGACVLRDPAEVNRKYRGGTIPRDRKLSRIPPRLNSTVLVGGGTSVSPTRTGSHEISSPNGTIGTVEVRNTQPFHTSINVNSAKNVDPMPTFSKVIGSKLSDYSSADV